MVETETALTSPPFARRDARPAGVALSPARAFPTQSQPSSTQHLANTTQSWMTPPFSTHIVPKDSRQIIRADRNHYVGLLKSFPPPSAMYTDWANNTRVELVRDLSCAIRQTHCSLPSNERTFTPQLCYAGKAYRKEKIPDELKVTNMSKSVVILQPAVWIHCPSRKCYQKIKSHLPGLGYIDVFRRKYDITQETYVWHLDNRNTLMPWMHSKSEDRSDLPFSGMKFDISIHADTARKLPRIMSRFSIWNSSSRVWKESTTGGFVCVGDRVFGLTTAHGIVFSLDNEQAPTSEATSPEDTSSEGNDSDRDDTDFIETIFNHRKITNIQYHFDNPEPQIRDITETSSSGTDSTWNWLPAELPGILCYGNRGTKSADYTLKDDNADSESDFALIPFAPFSDVEPDLLNSYYCPDDQYIWRIQTYGQGVDTDNDIVWILNDPASPMKAHLLPGDHPLFIADSLMNMRMLQSDVAGYPGLSGAWVVRQDKLYGIVYGGYEETPYIYMLPINRVFDSIASFTGAEDVRIALRDDFHRPGKALSLLITPKPLALESAHVAMDLGFSSLDHRNPQKRTIDEDHVGRAKFEEWPDKTYRMAREDSDELVENRQVAKERKDAAIHFDSAKALRHRRDEYTVGWVCALPIEMAAAQEMLDEEHDDLERDYDYDDDNVYCLGSIGGHKIAIVCLPAGRIGSNPAAAVTTQMRATFKGIRFGLMVGIGGGVPSPEVDIRLGDVVVSHPHQTSSGVIQYDFGKTTPSGVERTGSLNSPPSILLAAVTKVQAHMDLGRSKLSEHLFKLGHIRKWQRQMAGPDVLFQSTYDHQGGQTCDLCNADKKEVRKPRESDEVVVVHQGTIASGNEVMKNGRMRDMVSRDLGGILCFEMEAAGLMNSFPCLVIRGICDYADSHKNKKWQPYAAATAAAYAKEVLLAIPPETRTVETTIPKRFCITAISRKEEQIDLFLCGPNGHVYTLWWLEGTGWSSDCTDVGGDFPPGARVTVVSRDGQKLDIFVCDINGRIFTSWWHVPDMIAFFYKWSMWSSWEKVGEQFPGGTEVAGIWSDRKSLDLFACAGDGQIHTLKWTNESRWSRNTQGDPLPRESPGFPTGAHVTVTARTEDHMDLFVCDSVGNVKTLGWNSLTGWSDWKLIGRQFLTDVAAIVPTGDIIELFACQRNGRIYTTKWTADSGWKPTWDCISSNTSFRAESTVVVTRLSPEVFQLFIHGSDGFIHTCWRSGPLPEWSTWKPINKQKFSGSVDITAVVRMGARAVDIFVSNNEVRVPTIWWTRGSVFSWEEWRILPFENVFKSD